PGLQQNLFEDRFGLIAKFIGTLSRNTDAEARTRQIQRGQFTGDTERLTGYLVRADLLATKQLRVFIGYADAPDASPGRVFQTRSLFGGAELAFDEQVSVRVSGSRANVKGSSDRSTLNVGLTVRF
ncbi:MAG: hypothetical protein H0V35_15505, partial [Nitrospira sp.]|nr:hypothetical protein [Nitrospira sp.]